MLKQFYERFRLFGLLTSQFLGAFNDNAWKMMVFTLATRPLLAGPDSNFELSSQTTATLSLLVFLLPMMLFSIPAGALADRFSKRNLMIATKFLEVAIMGAAAWVLFMAPLNLYVPFFLLGMMGLQSAFFGPAKYGILPEILPTEKLSKGNSLLEIWTMVAIIAGTGLGPILLAADHFGTRPDLTWIGALYLLGCSLIGLVASFAVPHVKSIGQTNKNPFRVMLQAWSAIKGNNALFLAFIGSVLYWFVISLLGQNVLVYAKGLALELEKGEIWQGIPPAAYGLGIALGALIAARFSSNRVELGLIPLGAIGFSLSSLLLGLLQPVMGGTIFILLLMGFSSGMLVVPLHTLIQALSPPQQRGAIIALGNCIDIGGMIAGSLAAVGMSLLGIGIGQMLILSALIVLLATVWAIKTLPAALVRFLFILLTRTVYRLKVRGFENVPKEGPYVVVSNHISCVDALFIMASLDRPVHFIMNEHYYKTWWLNPLARLMETIPVASSSNPRLLVEGIRRAGDYLDKGEIVCIFPEGQVTHTGMLLPFQRGVEMILRGRDCPVVPLYIDGVWGSIFSYKGGKFFKKWPQLIRYSLTVNYGKPLPAKTSVDQMRRTVQELENEAWMARRDYQKPLTHTFIHNVRSRPWAQALIDQNRRMSRLKTLTGAIALGRVLRESWHDQEVVALLLPPTIPAVLCNFAAALSGRPVVNLNFTTGQNALASTIRQSKISTVITSRAFMEKNPVPLPDGVSTLYLEDIASLINSRLKWSSLLMALFYEPEEIEKACGAKQPVTVDDTLSIIFTSGSTGEPKGVVLTHFNLQSNVDGVGQIVPGVPKSHRLMHSLPLFHSFGYMMMWLGLNHKHAMILHPNPMDFAVIGELVWKYQATLMMTTPTFLRGYMKRVLPGQFGTLKCVLTGAEKLPTTLAQNFELQFGLRPIEGYGATECSPVIATSTLNVREQGIYQLGTLPGHVGKPLPGVLVRVVDPESQAPLPCGQPGLLLVKGPNVMKGYLNRPDLTEKVIHDGWYITGDIAELDPEGFIKITDRLSRFSKIGGEMVPHIRVEEYLHQAAEELENQVFAVTALPDPQKGERLAVLHTLDQNQIADIIKELTKLGVPNLYIPKPDHFIPVKELPLLGTGKIDLKAIKAIAEESLR